jgi:hypothetical protein
MMTTLLEKCKHTVEGANATRQFHKSLRKSRRLEKLLMAAVLLAVATFTTNVAVAIANEGNATPAYAQIR